ncbi:unnamed protein product [Victoria cruziana]
MFKRCARSPSSRRPPVPESIAQRLLKRELPVILGVAELAKPTDRWYDNANKQLDWEMGFFGKGKLIIPRAGTFRRAMLPFCQWSWVPFLLLELILFTVACMTPC